MPKHLSVAQASALEASATTLLFHTLDMVKVHPDRPTEAERGAAAALLFSAAFVGGVNVWSRKTIVEALALACAKTMGISPDVGAFIQHWQDALGVRFDAATPGERLARKARQDFIDMVARLETADEVEQRTGECMSGDDAVDTVSSLVDAARRLSKHDASQTFHFSAEVPGHAAPEGGQL